MTYWKFCRELKNNGMRVLGIGDSPYDDLLQELRDSLDEYYKVSSLENYDEGLQGRRLLHLQIRQDRLAGEQQRILADAGRGPCAPNSTSPPAPSWTRWTRSSSSPA